MVGERTGDGEVFSIQRAYDFLFTNIQGQQAVDFLFLRGFVVAGGHEGEVAAVGTGGPFSLGPVGGRIRPRGFTCEVEHHVFFLGGGVVGPPGGAAVAVGEVDEAWIGGVPDGFAVACERFNSTQVAEGFPVVEVPGSATVLREITGVVSVERLPTGVFVAHAAAFAIGRGRGAVNVGSVGGVGELATGLRFIH